MRMMKWVILQSLFVSSFALSQGKYAPGTFDIDAEHSKVGFEIPHLVISTVEGRFTEFEGKVVLADKFEKSSVTASVNINTIDTSNAKRDEHLRAPDFFDAKKFPKMTFESKEIAGDQSSFKMTGPLTIKGITKTVTFDSKYLGSVGDGFGNQKVAFSAKTKINRKDFGLTWNNVIEVGPVVGDEVTIELRIEAGHPLATQAKK